MKPAFVFSWQSPSMPTQAFWYYEHERIAKMDREVIAGQLGYVVSEVEPRDVPDDTPLLDHGEE